MKLIENIKKKIALNKIEKCIKKYTLDAVVRQWKILNIMRIVQMEGMQYSSGHFYYPGGFAMPDFRTEEQKKKDLEEKTKDWTQFKKDHGYEKGSYMDIINTKYGGVKDITVSQNWIGPIARVDHF